MNEANFSTGMDELRIPALTQWDKHQKLTISGLGLTDSVFHVHFANAKSEEAIVRMAYLNDGVYEVDIPNSLLEEKHTIYAYLYLIEYETAVVDSATEGSYYTKSGNVYTKVTLPAEYATGVTYYKQKGKTVKTVIIPVKPRKKPDGYISEDKTDEELIDELMRYCNNLGHRLDYYTNLVNEYRSKDLVRLVSRAEYDALVTANKLETGVIYCIKEEDTLDVMMEIVAQQVGEGMENGDIVVGKVAKAVEADKAKELELYLHNVELEYPGGRLFFQFHDGIDTPYSDAAFTAEDVLYQLSAYGYTDKKLPCTGVYGTITPLPVVYMRVLTYTPFRLAVGYLDENGIQEWIDFDEPEYEVVADNVIKFG